MAEVVYETKRGDSIDLICYQHYGHTQNVVEKVLERNRGLSLHGVLLPAGLQIVLPEIAAPESGANTRELVRLWD